MDKNLWASLEDQVETALSSGSGLQNTSRWVTHNIKDPQNPHKSFSFSGHEYQRAILDDTSPIVSTRKATQIGLSTISIVQALAVCAKLPAISAIYVLPSIRFAQKFSSSRVSPVIEASPRLKGLLNREVSSNELRQIGNSFLYFTGAAANSSAISIPARALFVDELAFADAQVLSVFASRLGHQAEHEKIIRYFSSPLYPHSDISALYEQGDQKLYMTYHRACGQWIYVDVIDDMVLPGYDDHLSNITYSDVGEGSRAQVDSAYFKCPSCGNPVTTENLSDPDCRAWVPTYTDREISSYDATPLVLPWLRTAPALLKELRNYRNSQRWLQYACGRPAESASDTILASTLDRAFTVPPISPRSGGIYGAALGCDVGKVSHVAIGRKVGQVLEIVWLETVRQDADNATGRTLVERYQQYRCLSGVIDAAPDISTPRWVAGQLPYGQVWGCYFIRGRGKSDLRSWAVDEREGVVKVSRTRALDEFVEQMNKGLIRLPIGLVEEEEVRAHLQRLKRIINYDTAGEESAQWIASDPETHWFFAVFYCWLATEMIEESGVGVPVGLPLGNLVSKVRLAA